MNINPISRAQHQKSSRRDPAFLLARNMENHHIFRTSRRTCYPNQDVASMN